MDRIRVEGLKVECVVGVYPRERDSMQPLSVDLTLWLDTRTAAVKESLRASVDYAAIAGQVAFLLKSCRFRMLETAAHAVACYLLAPPALGERRAAIVRVGVQLTKPTAWGGLGGPSLAIERDASDVQIETEHSSFGIVDIIHETRDAGIYRLNVAPKATIPLHVHRVMQESELVLSDGLLCQGVPAAVGSVRRWPRDVPHRYDNPTDRYQTILCVDSPPFVPSDEVEITDADPARALTQVPFELAWPT
jgi:FolB domain-containing protein